jgi:uncharacterized protein YjeT (DUF2065 family)
MLAHTLLLVFGLYFMACGIALLTGPNRMAGLIDELEASPAIGFLCGAVMIFAAGGTLSVQNGFSSATDGLATILVAVSLVEGLLLVAWPKPLWGLAHWMMPDDDHLRGFGIVSLALGAVVFAIGAL